MRFIGMKIETQNVFEIRKTVIAAKSHVVAEKRQHQSVGKGLSND